MHTVTVSQEDACVEFKYDTANSNGGLVLHVSLCVHTISFVDVVSVQPTNGHTFAWVIIISTGESNLHEPGRSNSSI